MDVVPRRLRPGAWEKEPISEIVNYLGQVTSEVKRDNFRFVARETMLVNKQMYAGNPFLRYYFDRH